MAVKAAEVKAFGLARARRTAAFLADRAARLGPVGDLARLSREQAGRVAALEAEAGIQPGGEAAALRNLERHLGQPLGAAPLDPGSGTLYASLAELVRCSEESFRTLSRIAGHAADDAARNLAETLAREQLAWAATLRVERRKAYHAERAAGRCDVSALARSVETLPDLHSAALGLERELAAALETAPAGKATRALSLTREIIADLGGNASSLGGTAPADSAAQRLDEVFRFYDAVQARAADEAVMTLAQGLTQRTLERIQAWHGTGGAS